MVTLASKVLLPANVVVVDQAAEPTVKLVAFAQVAPPSYETCTDSPVARFALNVPLIVWLDVFVIKSVALLPVSAESEAPVTVVVGKKATVNVSAVAAATTVLPAKSLTELALMPIV